MFQEYIIPALSLLPRDNEELVRIAFAECLPLLASIASRYLDNAHSLRCLSSAKEMACTNDVGSSDVKVHSGNAVERKYSMTKVPIISGSYDAELHSLKVCTGGYIMWIISPIMCRVS